MILGLRVYLLSLNCYLADEGTGDHGVDSAGECWNVEPVSPGRGLKADHTFISTG